MIAPPTSPLAVAVGPEDVRISVEAAVAAPAPSPWGSATASDWTSVCPAPKAFTCLICLGPEEGADPFPVPSCAHAFCRACLQSYCALQIAEGVTDIRCPALEGEGTARCEVVLTDADVSELVTDPEMVRKYVRFKALKENPDLRECPRCGRFQVGDPLHPQIHCEACGLAYCFAHGSAHPPSESCADYEQRSTPAATRDLLRRTSKPCPKCKAPTFRATGCNHMKCTQCKADWCWLCGESITVRGTGVFPSHYDWRSLDSPCAGMQYTDDENARGGQSPYRKACRILLFYSPLAIPFYLQAMLVYLLITVFTAPCLAASASYRAYWFRMSIIHSVVTIGYATIGSAVAFLCLGLVAVVAWVLLLIGGVLGLPFLPCFVSSRAGCARYLRFLCCWPFDFLPSGASDTQ